MWQYYTIIIFPQSLSRQAHEPSKTLMVESHKLLLMIKFILAVIILTVHQKTKLLTFKLSMCAHKFDIKSKNSL